MTSADMAARYTDKTGKPCRVVMSEAGPSISAVGKDGKVHGIVIPIDDTSRPRAVDALIHYTT